MADTAQGAYTGEFSRRLDRQQRKSMAERFLLHAHPTETAIAKAELDLFKDMDDSEKLSYVVQLNRGSNGELAVMTAAAFGFYGAGRVMQSWFPYTVAGNVPTLPTVIGAVGLILGFAIKRRSAFRFPLAMASVGVMLGGGSISGMKI